jgi:hypothetical protein
VLDERVFYVLALTKGGRAAQEQGQAKGLPLSLSDA